MSLRCEEPGWICLARPDGRRGVWIRLTKRKLEMCAGREGDDDYVEIELSAEQEGAVEGILASLAYAYALEEAWIQNRIAEIEEKRQKEIADIERRRRAT